MIKLKDIKGRKEEDLFSEWKDYSGKYIYFKKKKELSEFRERNYDAVYKIGEVSFEKSEGEKDKMAFMFISCKVYENNIRKVEEINNKKWLINTLNFKEYEVYLLDECEANKMGMLIKLSEKHND